MSANTRWEYLSIFVDADAKREEDFLRENWDWKDGIPSFTPESMMPRLNALGEQGWELMHIQPAYVGNRADIMVGDSGSGGRSWTSKYFCVFKKPK